MKQIAVFGASGRTGKLFTELALKNGYGVKALVRTPSRLELQHSSLEIVHGDVLDSAKVGETIKATDAVIILIGNRKDSPPDLRRTSTQHILNAMQQKKMSRLIMLTSPFAISSERDKPSFYFKFAVFMTKPLFGAALVEDGQASLDLIRRSELDWTIVRAPTLNDKPSMGNYQVGRYLDANTGKVASRSDVAAFLLEVLMHDKYIREMPIVSS
jgi:putative NADH-flavin reductase